MGATVGVNPSLSVAADPPQVVFYAMGDVPYKPTEDILLPIQVAEIPADAEFVVHVGDIKPGSVACDEDIYVKVSGILSKSKAPVFIIPGDNEWNDCTDPGQAWDYWDRYFVRFDQRWSHGFRMFRQVEQEANFAFVRGGVLFVGLNLVGGRVHDANEWKRRLADNADWLDRNLTKFGPEVGCAVVLGHANPRPDHQDFFKEFTQSAGAFGKPVLYLHGDGHRWIHDRPFEAKNILRVQVDQGGIAPPLRVAVTADPKEPFVFDRRKPAKAE